MSLADDHVLEAPREAVLARTETLRLKFGAECASAIDLLGARGDWQGALEVATKSASLSQAEIARGLEVMRSTVTRWVGGQSRPAPEALPELVDKLKALVLAAR